jgi:integrase
LTLPEAARIMRDAVKDKSYRAFPIGQEAARHLRSERKRLTESSYRDMEGCFDKLARYFADLDPTELEPPVGTERLDEFLDHQWGDAAPRTYNKNHSYLRSLTKGMVLRGVLHGDPMLPIRRAKARGVHRETFSADQRLTIFAANPEQPDASALRLVLTYGLRKGALQVVRFEHFDFDRRRLTIFTKGGKVQIVPIPDPAFWAQLDIHMRELGAHPKHYLLCRQKTVPRAFDASRKATGFQVVRWPEQPMGGHGLHSWWYRCLANAGVTPTGVESGERLHKARHTAGQRVLDATRGNLKAVQKLLGHSSIQTTGDIYTDWDDYQLADTLMEIEGP